MVPDHSAAIPVRHPEGGLRRGLALLGQGAEQRQPFFILPGAQIPVRLLNGRIFPDCNFLELRLGQTGSQQREGCGLEENPDRPPCVFLHESGLHAWISRSDGG